MQPDLSSHARHRAHAPQLGGQPITASELQQQACASGGKAAGPDGWSGDEIQHWTLPMWQTYADLWNGWINHRCYPSEWQYFLQVHLCKQDPRPVHGLDGGDARPSVSNLFSAGLLVRRGLAEPPRERCNRRGLRSVHMAASNSEECTPLCMSCRMRTCVAMALFL